MKIIGMFYQESFTVGVKSVLLGVYWKMSELLYSEYGISLFSQ